MHTRNRGQRRERYNAHYADSIRRTPFSMRRPHRFLREVETFGGSANDLGNPDRDVRLDSGPIRVRLHAADTPERAQSYGKEATVALATLVLNKTVEVEPFEQDPPRALRNRRMSPGQ
jgi:endonuclease YncB( thermonuclease family)